MRGASLHRQILLVGALAACAPPATDESDPPASEPFERPTQLDQLAFDDLSRGFACTNGFQRVFALDDAGTVRLQLSSPPNGPQSISLLIGRQMYAIFDQDGCDGSIGPTSDLQWTRMMYLTEQASFRTSDTDTHRYVTLTDVTFTPFDTTSDALDQERPYGNASRLSAFELPYLSLRVPLDVVPGPIDHVDPLQ